MTPEGIYQVCNSPLATIGPPIFDVSEGAEGRETLRYLPPADGEPGTWALVPVLDAGEAELDDMLPLDPLLAAELIRGHLRSWLGARGWQVQMKMSRQRVTWRLVDCLAITEGGGDRLDDHYPSGEDELSVLADSVVTLARHGMG